MSDYFNSSKSITNTPDYLNSSYNKQADKRTNGTITNRILNAFNNLFSGIGCFEDMFSLQVKEGSHLYQVPPRRVAYILQKPLKEELEWLQKQWIIVLLGVGRTSEWCNSFILVPNANWKVRLCLDLAQFNKALHGLVHRGPTLNNIQPRPMEVKYLTLIDAGSKYHSLKLEEKSSYLMAFSCPFGRSWCIGLSFGAALTDDMFQKKIDELLNDISNLFGIVDDILIAGFDRIMMKD